MPHIEDPNNINIRLHLLEGAKIFLQKAREIPGVSRIAVIGSIVTEKLNPKDIDILVTVSEDCDLAALASVSTLSQRKSAE